jgi:hypothetical protein
MGYDTVFVTAIPLASVNYITQVKTGTTVSFGSDAINTTSYLWSFGDGSTANVATPTHTYASNGNYTVRMLAINQCAVDTATTTVTIGGVGIGNTGTGSDELVLSPNPAASSVFLVNNGKLNMRSVVVLNGLGAVVLLKDGIDPKKEMLDLSTLPAGTYLVRIQTDFGVFLRRLQLQR